MRCEIFVVLKEDLERSLFIYDGVLRGGVLPTFWRNMYFYTGFNFDYRVKVSPKPLYKHYCRPCESKNVLKPEYITAHTDNIFIVVKIIQP
jgi:hypothetical protein